MKKKALIKAKTITEKIDGKTKTREIIPGNFNESDPVLMNLWIKQHNHRKSLRRISKGNRRRNR